MSQEKLKFAGHIALFIVQTIVLFAVQAVGIIAGIFVVPMMLALGKFDLSSQQPFTDYNTHRNWVREVFPKVFWPWDNIEDSSTGDHRGWWDLETGDSRKWLSRFRWLAIRNPFNNFKRYVIGIDVRKYYIERLAGQFYVRDDLQSQGFQFLRADPEAKNTLPRYMLYYVRAYKDRSFSLFGKTFGWKNRAIVIQIGNKIKIAHNNTIEKEEIDYFKGFTVEFNPFKDIG